MNPSWEYLKALEEYCASKVNAFWIWWRNSLVSWLPPSWQAAFGLHHARLLLLPQDGQIELIHFDSDGLFNSIVLPGQAEQYDLGAILIGHKASLPRFGLLRDDAVLRRSLVLPVAAERHLREILRFEIDRQTPFTEDQVYFDVRIVGHDKSGNVEVELVVTPRVVLEGLFPPSGAWRGQLDGVDVLGGNNVPLNVNLLPSSHRRQGNGVVDRRETLLLVTALALIALCGWKMLDNRRTSAGRLERQVEVTATRARSTAVKRQELQDLLEGQEFLASKSRGRATVTELLNELSLRLDDETQIEKLSINADNLRLIGLSAKASSLVSRLEDCALWEGSSLTSVIKAGGSSTRERFTLDIHLRGQTDRDIDETTSQTP